MLWVSPAQALSSFEGRNTMNRLVSFGLVLGLAALAGCEGGGPALGTVTGTVSMDGKPLANTAVTFIPQGGGGTASGITDASGKYELNYLDRKGALIGKHKVALTTVQQPSESNMANIPSDSPEYAKQAAAGASEYNKVFTEPIPAKYNKQTTLEEEVKAGSNEINFELTSM
jgi:hypothetical protein